MKPEGPFEPEIIYKKAKRHAHAHHGGAWKIAYADFVTAMMAFFMLLWILGATNEDQRKGLADYFTPTVIQLQNSGGSNGVMGGRSLESTEGVAPRSSPSGPRPVAVPGGGVTPTEQSASEKSTSPGRRRTADDTRFSKVVERVNARLAGDPTLKGLKGQVRFVRTRDGLRIDLVERADFAMFAVGTSAPTPASIALIRTVSRAIDGTPNSITIRGHTDSLGYQGPSGANNWTLSAARADATRRMLASSGVAANRFRRIEGVADTDLFVPADGADPRNRRISITLMNGE
ncbi:flagellar motor protein MotB [Sandarakinorhabdus sp.]|uniref:flagellar motor protein MotB n=1 Tax=Sandarakinorhabdus sp. TaxID=1916663 RepID=UPI00286E19C2|nr:flagellar motor protein MotB [Sandarakinorhabdus sp.]